MSQHRAEALFDFIPTAKVELGIKKGDVIVVRRMSVGEGWWEGELNGMRGLFPCSYVKLLPAKSASGNSPKVPKTPVTPGISKKASMDSLLAPPTLANDQFYNKEKASELFVQGHNDIGITGGPSWECKPPTYSITVQHVQPQSRNSGMKHWSTYVVETEQLSSSVTRKFKHFLWLYDKMAEMFPCISLPPLPVKQYSDAKDPDGVEARRRGLERFLARVAKHPVLCSTKLFHVFLTLKDDKEWKIGRQNSIIKMPKSAKKLFGAPVYTTVKYPAYNVPLNQLASIEKFSKFSRLVEMNIHSLQTSYLHVSASDGDMLNSLSKLGKDMQRFTRGQEPKTCVTQRKRLTTANITPGLTNGAHPGIHVSLSVPISQKVALDPEGEESEEDGEIGGGNWNWREDDRFSKMIQDLHTVAGAIRQMSQLGLEHEDFMERQVLDTLRDYSGIIHTLPMLVKLHEEAMDVYDASKEKDSKKEAEEVRQHCETLNNILLAEFDHFSAQMVDDFEGMMERFIQEQASFHRQLANEWDTLHRRYSKRLSSRRQSGKMNSSSPHSTANRVRSGSFSPVVSLSSLPDTLPSGMEQEPENLNSKLHSKSEMMIPTYINVQRKDSNNIQSELTDSDMFDPEILKPKKKKSLPPIPISSAPHKDTSVSKPDFKETDIQMETSDLSHYATCPLSDTSAPPPETGDSEHKALVLEEKDSISSSTQNSTPLTKLNISTRYETASPQCMVYVPNESTTNGVPHPYANLQFAIANKSITGQMSVPGGNISPKKSPTKKPVPIQRKINKSEEITDEGGNTSTVADADKTSAVNTALGKPIPPAKPPKLSAVDPQNPLLTTASYLTPATDEECSLTERSRSLSDSKGLTKGSTKGLYEEEESGELLKAVMEAIKPRSLTDVGLLPEPKTDPPLIPPTKFVKQAPHTFSSNTKESKVTEHAQTEDTGNKRVKDVTSDAHPVIVPVTSPIKSKSTTDIVYPVKPAKPANLMLQGKAAGSSVRTADVTAKSRILHQISQPPFLNTAASNPTTVSHPNTVPHPNTAASPHKTMNTPTPTGKVFPMKPSHGNIANRTAFQTPTSTRGGSQATDGTEPSKARDELMKKLSLRRMRIEEQLATYDHVTTPSNQNSSTGIVVTKPEAIKESPSSTSDRTSGISTSSSHSEVVVSYYTKKLEGGGSNTTSQGSSNGLTSGSYVVDGPSVIMRRQQGEGGGGKEGENDDTLAKYGIIEDVGGGSYVI